MQPQNNNIQSIVSPSQPQEQNALPQPPSDSGKPKTKLLIIIIVAVIVVICGLTTFLLLNKPQDSGSVQSIGEYTNIFGITNQDKLAVFDEYGKQLTEFEFDSKNINNNYRFQHGMGVLVRNNEYGIIGDSGEMIVDFGQYDYIERIADTFLVTEYGKGGKKYLINKDSEIIYRADDIEIVTYNKPFFFAEEGSRTEESYFIIKEKNSQKYKIMNSIGFSLAEFPVINGAEDPVADCDHNILIVFYNNMNYAVDLKENKLIAQYESSERDCTYKKMDNGDTIISHCNGANKEYSYRVLNKNGVINLPSECAIADYVAGERLYCSGNAGSYGLYTTGYVMNDNYEVAFSGRDGFLAYSDGVKYATNSSSITTVDFYDGDTKIKSIPNITISQESGYVKNGIFVVRIEDKDKTICSGGKADCYTYYNLNGEAITEKNFYLAFEFRDNIAVIEEEKGQYSFIDTTGKISDQKYDKMPIDFQHVGGDEDYKVFRDGKVGVVDNDDGKEIFSCEYDDVEWKYDGYWFTLKDGVYSMYTFDERQKIGGDSSTEPDVYESYFVMTSNEGKKQYYSYKTGEMFYEEK